MPRYFFHARLGDERIPDLVGVAIDDLENVRDYVLEAATELKVKDDWMFDVTDEDGEVQLVIPVAELRVKH
jgi:hypothetical protein